MHATQLVTVASLLVPRYSRSGPVLRVLVCCVGCAGVKGPSGCLMITTVAWWCCLELCNGPRPDSNLYLSSYIPLTSYSCTAASEKVRILREGGSDSRVGAVLARTLPWSSG